MITRKCVIQGENWITWSQPKLTSNTSYGTLSVSNYNYGSNMYGWYTLDSSTATWWETYTGVYSATLKWVLPISIKITGIAIQVRPGDRSNLTVQSYTSSAKTTKIGDSVTSSYAGQILTIPNIPSTGIITNTIFLDCSSTQDYLGIADIVITATKLDS